MNKKHVAGDSNSNEFLSGSLNYLDDIKGVEAIKRRRSLKPAIIMTLVIIGLSGGILVMLGTSNHPIEETTTIDSGNGVSDTQAQLSACIKSAQTNVEVGDPDFYPKLIANYKTQIDCYNRYDSENSSKKELEDKLSSVEVAARDAGISQAAIDAEYNRKAAQIEEEHRRYMAELDAREAREDAESQRRWEQMDAEATQQRAEQAAQQAQYEAQKKAREEAEARAQQEKIAKCNAYRAQYGSKTPQELAESDSEVRGRYDAWQRSIAKGKAATTPSERDKAQQQTYADYSAYMLKLQEKIGYYAQLSSVCD